MKFKSKIDIWMHLIFIAIAVLAVWALYINIVNFIFGAFIVLCICDAFMAAFVIPLRFNIYYEFTNNLLVMHYAFTDYKVPYEHILSVQNAFNAWNSPALSLDRLKITYRSDRQTNIIFISPKNKQKFIDELLSRNVLIEKL